MKKGKILAWVAALCAATLLTGLLAACGDGGENNGGEPQTYTITAAESEDYTLTPDKTSAAAGDTVTVTAVCENADKYITGVKYNEEDCDEEDGKYTFTMPAANVTLSAVTANYEQVLTDPFVWFDLTNSFAIAKDAEYNYSDILNTEWGLDFTFKSNKTFSSIKWKITSSDESVIPLSALDVEPRSKKDENIGGPNDFQIVKAKLLIDTTQIEVGSTWLQVYFETENISPKDSGTVTFKLTVYENGELPVSTMDETLEFDVSDIGDGTYTVMIGDSDYLPGSNVPATQTFTADSSNGKLTVSFKYTVAHKFWVRITQGEKDSMESVLRIEDAKDTDGAEYVGDTQERPGIGDLMFTEANVTLPLTVYSVNA